MAPELSIRNTLIRNHTAEKTSRGWRIVQSHSVTGYGGDSETAVTVEPRFRLAHAMRTGPNLGDDYASYHGLGVDVIPKAIAIRKSCAPIGPNTFEVTTEFSSEYGPDQLPATGHPSERFQHVSFSSVMATERTYVDELGKQIVVTYKDTRPDANGVVNDTRYRQAVAMEVSRPLTTATFSFRTLYSPAKIYEDLQNKVNEEEFLGYPAKSWLCASVAARTQSANAEQGFLVDVELVLNENTWDGQAIFLQDGFPPPDVSETNGTLSGVWLYERVKFSDTLVHSPSLIPSEVVIV